MKKIFKISCLICIMISVIGCAKKQAPKHIDLDVKSISNYYAIQVDDQKYKLNQFGKEKTINYFSKIDKLEPLTGEALKTIKWKKTETYPPKDYTSFILYKKDGTKQRFYFFQENKKWYLQTQEGFIYKKADFITDMVNYSSMNAEIVSNIQSIDVLKEMKKAKKLDLNFKYSLYLNAYKKNGMSEDEAINQTRKDLEQEEQYYEFVMKSELAPSNQEIEALYELQDATFRKSENFDSIEQNLKSANLSYDEYIKKQKEFLKKDNAFTIFSNKMKKQFYDGLEDHVGKKECWSAEEYWNTYLKNVLIPKSEKYDLKSFDKQLDKAQKYYEDNK